MDVDVMNEVLRKWDLYFAGLTNVQKKKMGFEIDEGQLIDWENGEEACVQLEQLWPELEAGCGAAWIVHILDVAKSNPEGMDIDKLRASALSMSILTETTINHMVAAGGMGQDWSSLVIDKIDDMVYEARSESRLVVEKKKEQEDEARKRQEEQEIEKKRWKRINLIQKGC